MTKKELIKILRQFPKDTIFHTTEEGLEVKISNHDGTVVDPPTCRRIVLDF